MVNFLNTVSVENIASLVAIFVGLISIVISVLTLRQNNKMIEESTRPYIVIYQTLVNFQSPIRYIVLKNYGTSAAYVTMFECEDLENISTYKIPPFSGIKGTIIAPGQSYKTVIEPQLFKKDIETLNFKISYESSKKSYTEEYLVDLKSNAGNLSSRPSGDNYGKLMTHAIQELTERNL